MEFQAYKPEFVPIQGLKDTARQFLGRLQLQFDQLSVTAVEVGHAPVENK